MINIVLMLVVLHSLPVMLVLEDFGQDSFCASWDALMVYGTSAITLNAHSSSMNCIELILAVVGSRGSLSSSCSWRRTTLCN